MKIKKKFSYLYIFIFLLVNCSGCATTNPATGERHFTFISEQKEIELGKSISENVEEHFGIVSDLKSQSRVERIGNTLVQYCTRKNIIYHFEILKEKEEPNALSLPGGYVYITEGLFKKLNTDSQIASVLAHEMAHIEARHSIYKLQKSLGYGTLMMIIESKGSKRTKEKAIKAINELFLAYSRKDEYQADSLALELLSKSKYNQTAMLEVLQIIKKIKEEKPIEKLHPKTHPYIHDRIRQIKISLTGKINFKNYINRSYKIK